MVPKDLLELLVCPADRADLEERGEFLVCTRCGRRYPVRDGIPVMLIDEALPPEEKPAGTAQG